MTTRSSSLLRICSVLAACWAAAVRGADAGGYDSVYRALATDSSGVVTEQFLAEGKVDLRDAKFSEFFLEKMNRPRQRGESPVEVMKRLLALKPASSYEWLLRNYDKLGPAGRMNLVMSLARAEYTETYDLLTLLVQDKTLVPDTWRGKLDVDGATSWEWRVCDSAYVALINRLIVDGRDVPDEMPKLISHELPIAQRNAIIARFVSWWKTQRPTVLSEKRSLSAEFPEVGQALTAIKARNER
jgi:hypothetical protein